MDSRNRALTLSGEVSHMQCDASRLVAGKSLITSRLAGDNPCSQQLSRSALFARAVPDVMTPGVTSFEVDFRLLKA
jgi:hypothetical protein